MTTTKKLLVTFRPSEHRDGFFRTSYELYASDEKNNVTRTWIEVKTPADVDAFIDKTVAELVLPEGDFNAWAIKVDPGYKSAEFGKARRKNPWPRGFKARFERTITRDVKEEVTA